MSTAMSRDRGAGTRPPAASLLQRGTVVRLIVDRGFGFIRGEDDGYEYCFHRSSAPDFDALEIGMRVTFRPQAAQKGPRAESVECVRER